MQKRLLVRAVASAFLAGEPKIESIVNRSASTLGQRWQWLKPLATRYVTVFVGRTRPRHRDIVQFLVRDAGFRRALSRYFDQLSVEQWLTGSQKMQPVHAARNWDLPKIESPSALADWLGLDPGELRWFADLKALGYKRNQPKLRHYSYKVLAKQFAHVRLIEIPKPRLKELQHRILRQILEKVPAHPATHGFVKGRSIKSFVAPHVAQRVVLRMDLKDFFPSFSGPRIQAFFRTLGYPEQVADLLGGICTNVVPLDVWKGYEVNPQHRELRDLYARPHLPQGAPTSPALANLCSYRMDCRLSGLASAVGASYTRYADDLAFSGDREFERRVERFSIHAAAISMGEGFGVNFRKTRVMREGVRQYLAGLVINKHSNVRRDDFDRLKAILTNCIRFGPESQNRDANRDFRSHLNGRVGFVEMVNPAKGKRLRRVFERIQW